MFLFVSWTCVSVFLTTRLSLFHSLRELSGVSFLILFKEV